MGVVRGSDGWLRYSRQVLTSRRWQVLRHQILERDRWQCRECDETRGLEVDHIESVRTAPIVPVPEGSAEDMDALRASFRGRRGAALVIEGTAQATAAGMNPSIGEKPSQLSPDLQRTLADTLLRDARASVFSVFGILPGLHNPAATGPLVREAQRHLAQLVLQPVANQIAEEATDKLGSVVSIDVAHSMGVHDHGGRARAFSTIVGAMATAKEAGLDPAAISLAASRAGLDT